MQAVACASGLAVAVVVATWAILATFVEPSLGGARQTALLAATARGVTATDGSTAPTRSTVATLPSQQTTVSVPATRSAVEDARVAADSGRVATRAAVGEAGVPFPDAPAVEPRTITRLHPKGKLVAITLDDGYSYDSRLFALFDRYHATATTFLLGEVVASSPRFIKRLQGAGFEIANHSWNHRNLAKMSALDIETDLSRAQKAISAVTGDQAPYMRPPGGESNDTVERAAAGLGYTVVLWSKTFADSSRSATPQRTYHRIMDDLKPGDIILCHWNGKGTYGAMQMILPELERRGYRAVTLSELIAASGGYAR